MGNRISLGFLAVSLVLATQSASAQDLKRGLNVIQGMPSPDFGYLPTYIARAKGFLTNEGLDVKLVIMRSSVAVPALLSREIHFAVAGSAITAALKGAPLKAIFFTYNTSIFVFTVRPEVRSADDLRGKVVAIASPGGSHDQATRLILQKLGLEPGRDVNLLPIGDAKARVIGMETGQIAGSANNPDIAAELVRKGYRVLANSAEVYPVPFSGLAINDQLTRENPDLIKRWLRAHLRALLLVRQQPDEAAKIAAQELKLELGVSKEAIKQALSFMSSDDPGGSTEKGMRAHIQYSAPRLGVDPDKVPISQVADLSLLREVQRELGIYCRDGYLCPPAAR
jgi:NitT/TauT family transport system substrate-binding protein